MSKIKETIEIKKIHDNDKYVITRKTEEEMSGDELVKVYEKIKEAREENSKQLEEIPKQYELRLEFLKKEQKLLKERESEFEKHSKKIKEPTDSEVKNPIVQ